MNIPDPFHAQPYHFTITAGQVWAAVAIAAVAAINYVGVRTAGRVQILITGSKVAAIVLIVGLGLTLKDVGGMHPMASAAFAAYGGAGTFLTGLVPIMLAYNGFQTLGQIGGEIIDPHKTVPRAAIFGVLAVVVLYLLINVVYFRVLGLSVVANSQHIASDVVVKLAGPTGARWLTILMILSAFGALHANFLARPRIAYALAQAGQFFRFVKRIQPVFRTPSGALFLHGCMAVALVLTGSFEEIYSLGIFAIWIFLALTMIALIRLRQKEPELRRPYRTWGYPWPLDQIFLARDLRLR